MTFIDSILSPLLQLPQIAAILLVALCASLIMTLAYKWMTDQTLMRALREELKKYQKQMKETSDTSQMLALQKKAMDANMKYMVNTLKPTLLTMLPLLLVFGWLSAHFAYEPLFPDREFTIIANTKITGSAVLEPPEGIVIDQAEKSISNGKAEWNVKGEEGEFLFTIKAKDNEYAKDVIISQQQRYAAPEKKINDGVLDSIEVPMKKLVVLNLFGWELGWLGTYIIFSLIFSILLRKMLDVQ